MAIVCKNQETQLEKLVADKIKKNGKLTELGVDKDALIKKTVSTLAPHVKSQGLTGISKLIDQRVNDEIYQEEVKNSTVKKIDTNHYNCNDTNFVLENWVTTDEAPLISTRVSNLKRLHRDILVPIVKYYKDASTDANFRNSCVLQIMTGLSTNTRFQSTPVGEISRHYTGEAVNFRINGIDDDVIIQDLKDRKLPVVVGAFGNPFGVFVTLPYEVNGTTIQNVHVFTDKMGSLAYEFV